LTSSMKAGGKDHSIPTSRPTLSDMAVSSSSAWSERGGACVCFVGFLRAAPEPDDTAVRLLRGLREPRQTAGGSPFAGASQPKLPGCLPPNRFMWVLRTATPSPGPSPQGGGENCGTALHGGGQPSSFVVAVPAVSPASVAEGDTGAVSGGSLRRRETPQRRARQFAPDRGGSRSPRRKQAGSLAWFRSGPLQPNQREKVSPSRRCT
jgi:hypothetical protein